MCSIGHALLHPEFNGNFLYYGSDPSVEPFLRAQKFCKDVKTIRPQSVMEYRWSIHALCIFQRHHPKREEMVNALAVRAGLDRKQILQYQVSAEMKHTMGPAFWKSTDLPKESEEWALSVIKQNGNPNVMLHPYSFQSNSLDRHWPHWETALDWFSKQNNYNFYLTGLGWEYKSPLRNLTNLIGKSRTNNDVLALQKLCDLTVCTSCNLSHYATIADKPTISCLNQAVTNPRWFFRQCYMFDGAILVENHEPFRKLRDSFLFFFKGSRPALPRPNPVMS